MLNWNDPAERQALAWLLTARASADDDRLTTAAFDRSLELVDASILPSHVIDNRILRVEGRPDVIVDALWRASTGQPLQPEPDTQVRTDATIEDEVARLHRVCAQYEADAEAILAPALGYPAEQPGDPGYVEGRPSYVTGDHVAQSLMTEAARALAGYRAAFERITATVQAVQSPDAPVDPQAAVRAVSALAAILGELNPSTPREER